jgi:hypothetical protein
LGKDATAKLIIYALLVSAVMILRTQSIEPVGCRHNCPTEFSVKNPAHPAYRRVLDQF